MKDPFYAILAMQLHPKIASRFQVEGGCWCAATDGRCIYLNPDGWLKLTPLQQAWVIRHELLHCVLRHPTRLHTRDIAYWNIAADFVVNMVITSKKEELPLEGVLWDDQYKKMDADTIYQLIKEDMASNPAQEGLGLESGKGSGKGADEFKRIAKGLGATPHSAMQDPFIDQETGEPIDPQDVEHYKVQIESNWRAAFANACQVASGKGNYPAGLETLVEREHAPRLPWERLLQQWVQARVREGYDWMRPNKRFVAEGLYLPGRGKPALGDVVIIVDTSGSVKNELLSAFLGEIEGVLKAHPARVFLVSCDTHPVLTGVYDNAYDFPDQVQVAGRGGTDFRPGIQWIEDHSGPFCDGECLMDDTPGIAIYLTDGMGTYPEDLPEGLDMLWVLSINWEKDSEFYPPIGETIIAFEDLG
jgi:predicted metal-dependent peptidase